MSEKNNNYYFEQFSYLYEILSLLSFVFDNIYIYIYRKNEFILEIDNFRSIPV